MALNVKILAQLPALHDLSPTTLERLATGASVIARKARKPFYEQGDDPTGLYLLQAGRVKLYRQSRDRVQILAVLMPGEYFGAEALPEGAPSPYSATALTAADAIYIPPELLRAALEDCPDLRVVLLELVSARLRHFVALVHNLAFRDVSARLATVLMGRAEAEGEPTDEGVVFERVLSQGELAAMVGTAREVVYRICKKFERDGIIRLTGSRVHILDPDRLSAIANQESR